mgnify:CR=1 FL=1
MEFETNMSGKHKILNAVAAMSVSLYEGITFDEIKIALE